MNHTPTPWICHSGMIWKPDGSPDGIPIARMDRETILTAPTERDANAHFIVKACNFHDELQAMLTELTKEAESLYNIEIDDISWTDLKKKIIKSKNLLERLDDKQPENENCLYGMRCPSCGSLEPFQIIATASFTVFDSGTEEHSDVSWEDSNWCICKVCGADGNVSNFKKEK